MDANIATWLALKGRASARSPIPVAKTFRGALRLLPITVARVWRPACEARGVLHAVGSFQLALASVPRRSAKTEAHLKAAQLKEKKLAVN
ncbi:hypothetical protein [Thiorhodococcus minor]|uniref:Uncharacterized protein n=1 Tax=Thiorhodococcus minor TaxID=57489 RepID=A0A6M0JXF6_9GAMM|nr:hypothetical protein [Thiorhodococcus minor]NEV60997.1 hypothetical protein [Thiorhodococcus minor]